MDNSKLILALDVETLDEAKALVETLGDTVSIYKVGSQLFTVCGPEVVKFLESQGKKVFLDLKWHDIPNTVANAVAAAVNWGAGGTLFMCTIHTLGGQEMMERAAQSAREQAALVGVERPYIVGITVLTSDAKQDNIHEIVLERAKLAKQSGLDGVVASSQEASMLRKEFGEDFIIVTPGIRPSGADAGDQKRVTTPKEAITNGSSFLVVGRPIVKAGDPYRAAESILSEINSI